MTSLIIDINIDPVLIHLGPVAIHWYGLMYVVGIMAGIRIAFPYLERFGITPEQSYRVFWPTLVACLVGGRLYYVMQSNLGWFLRHPARIVATWEGGMAFYGAVFLGVPVAWVFCARHQLSFPKVLDGAALFIPIAQTFGRIGNVINGDIVGYPSALPWATRYTNASNTFVGSHVIAYQPAAVYEMIFSAVLFALLWRIRLRVQKVGILFVCWLTIYALGQLVLFTFRANPVTFFGLKQAQLTSILILVLVLPIAFWLYGRNASPAARAPE